MNISLDRPDISRYPTVEGNWKAPEKGSLTVEFFGTSTLLFRSGETAVMIDGFLSRPSLEHVLSGPIEPDVDVIDDVLSRAGIDALDAVICVHSHYDHAFDSPIIAQKFGAPLIGSSSTANIGRGYGLSEDLLRTVVDGESINFGDIELTFVASIHCPGDVSPGSIDQPLILPATIDAWHSGECYTLVVRHPSGIVLVQASANFVPGKLDGISADTVYLGIGMLGKQDEEFREEYWNQVVRLTGVTTVFPIHWDDFMTPLAGGPLQAQPSVMDDAIAAMEYAFGKGRSDGLTVLLPALWNPVDPFVGPNDAS